MVDMMRVWIGVRFYYSGEKLSANKDKSLLDCQSARQPKSLKGFLGQIVSIFELSSL